MGKTLLTTARAWEQDDKLYIVTPVAPFGPNGTDIEEYAFSKELLGYAPNDNLLWLKGAYAEADKPNLNGQMWTNGEIALKHLTPRLMPVTVMHDPSTAVGLIADARLLTPEADQVPRSRIETSLALWQHRFPEVAEEVMHNYADGSLMQSMECISSSYECSECGTAYPKLPNGAEEDRWCEHLKGESANGRQGARILRDVVFTGTGLIFGSRGSRGAYTDAHLDVFQDEIANFHTESHRKTKPKQPRSKTNMDEITIPRSEYAELQKRVPAEDLAAAVKRAEDAEAAQAAAVKETEAAEVAQKAAEDAKAASDKELKDAKEAANASELAEERLGKLGEGFTAKLSDSIKTRLNEQAKSMSDDDWTARLEELAELTGVKADEEAEDNGDEFTETEVAAAGVGKGAQAPKTASPQVRRSVFAGVLDGPPAETT